MDLSFLPSCPFSVFLFRLLLLCYSSFYSLVPSRNLISRCCCCCKDELGKKELQWRALQSSSSSHLMDVFVIQSLILRGIMKEWNEMGCRFKKKKKAKFNSFISSSSSTINKEWHIHTLGGLTYCTALFNWSNHDWKYVRNDERARVYKTKLCNSNTVFVCLFQIYKSQFKFCF